MEMPASAFAAAVLAMPCVYAHESETSAVEVAEETASRSRLVWAGDGVATNGIVSYYRHSFFLPAKPEKAALKKAGVASFSSGNTVAVVTSPRERLRMDGRPDSPFTRLVCQQPYIDICRSGAAFDTLSLEDYLANPRGYKTVVFLDAFYLTAEERAALKNLTRKPCVTSVWIGPAGGVTDAKFASSVVTVETSGPATWLFRVER